MTVSITLACAWNDILRPLSRFAQLLDVIAEEQQLIQCYFPGISSATFRLKPLHLQCYMSCVICMARHFISGTRQIWM